MAKKSAKVRHKSSSRRASWRGSFAFGLVTFPVEAFNAFNPGASDIHFHQIHVKCHSRIHYQKVCPIHGDVSTDEIVSGYEYSKGKYVELEPNELAELRPESDRALKIDAFVSPATVDPLYFDGRMYYLVPADAVANEPYAVILEAMEKEERCGVGHLIFSGKDQIALIRPLEGVLQMAMLNYEAEIRPPAETAALIKKPAHVARQVRLAQTLIKDWTQDDFDFSQYEDQHRSKVKELIDAKIKGHEIVKPAAEKPAKVLNLMDALKRSMGTGTSRRSPAKKRSKKSA